MDGAELWGCTKALIKEENDIILDEADGMRSVPESPGTLLYLSILRGIRSMTRMVFGGCSVQSFETPQSKIAILTSHRGLIPLG